MKQKPIKSDLAKVDRLTDEAIDYTDIPALDEVFLTAVRMPWPPAKRQGARATMSPPLEPADRDAKLAKLRAAIEEGDRSPDAPDGVFERIRERHGLPNHRVHSGARRSVCVAGGAGVLAAVPQEAGRT